ncbi:MAG: hypothetical protein ACXV8U_22880 [Methylobacter sp.]
MPCYSAKPCNKPLAFEDSRFPKFPFLQFIGKACYAIANLHSVRHAGLANLLPGWMLLQERQCRFQQRKA